jgi:hypothetical protein
MSTLTWDWGPTGWHRWRRRSGGRRISFTLLNSSPTTIISTTSVITIRDGNRNNAQQHFLRLPHLLQLVVLHDFSATSQILDLGRDLANGTVLIATQVSDFLIGGNLRSAEGGYLSLRGCAEASYVRGGEARGVVCVGERIGRHR